MKSSSLSLIFWPFIGSVIAAIRPPPVLTGDAVRIIATGGAVTPSSLATGENLLRTTYGLVIRRDPSLLEVDLYYAGSDTLRTQGLVNALAEADTKAIWAARGEFLKTKFHSDPRLRWLWHRSHSERYRKLGVRVEFQPQVAGGIQ